MGLQLGIIIPTINLLVLLITGFYGLSTMKLALQEMLKMVRQTNEMIISHEARINRLESRSEEHSKEMDRVRGRLDDFLDVKAPRE